MSENSREIQPQRQFCRERDSELDSFYNYPEMVSFCGASDDEIIEVNIRAAGENDSSPFWAWYEYSSKNFCFIYPAKLLVEMCAPDGFAGATKRGEGVLVNVIVERIVPAASYCIPKSGMVPLSKGSGVK